MLVLTWCGVIGLMMAIVPAVALLPILLYIGMLIGAQAFQESPHKHAPAVVIAIVPTIAAWGVTQINKALGAAGTSADKVGLDALATQGVLYQGLHTLGSGATLCGIILGSITALIIDRKMAKAAAFALTGAVLTFFGLIHSEAIGIMKTPAVAASYLIVAVFLYACSLRAHAHAEEPAEAPGHGAMPEHAVLQGA
jgi:AGZA family xanthine/uracil permease-like MFS transporter